MIITCPRCSTRYVIDPAVLVPSGRAVGCSSCGHHWTQEPSAPGDAATPVEAAQAADLTEETPEPPDDGTEADTQPESDLGGEVEGQTPSSAERPPEIDDPASLEPAGAPAAVADREEKPSVPEPPASNEPEVFAEPEPIPAALREGKSPADRGEQNRKRTPSVAMLAGLGALAAFVVIAIVTWLAVDQIVSAIPDAAGFYRAVGLLGDEPGAGLEIRDVRSARRRDGADEVLTIEGIVANVTNEPLDLPLIRVSLSDADGEELQFVTVPPNQPVLPPGETVSFEARIPNPSVLVRRVKVKFGSPADSSGAGDGG